MTRGTIFFSQLLLGQVLVIFFNLAGYLEYRVLRCTIFSVYMFYSSTTVSDAQYKFVLRRTIFSAYVLFPKCCVEQPVLRRTIFSVYQFYFPTSVSGTLYYAVHILQFTILFTPLPSSHRCVVTRVLRRTPHAFRRGVFARDEPDGEKRARQMANKQQ